MKRFTNHPGGVHRSCDTGAGLAGSAQISTARWIDVKPVGATVDPAAAQQRFGVGELSVILLGQELKADLVLIDDMKARKLARDKGQAVLGCVGVLHDAFGLKLLSDFACGLSSIARVRRVCRSLAAGKYSEDLEPAAFLIEGNVRPYSYSAS
jgi:hypothetical protein